MLGDIFNNFAHSVQINSEQDKKLQSQYFGLKKRMVFQIIKECERVGNKSYGLSKDEDKNIPIFVVDIPQVGQIKWHFPYEHGIKCKEYELELCDYRGKIDNQGLLCQEYSTKQLEFLGKRTKDVIFSENVQEMMGKLYPEKYKPKSEIDDLKKMVITPEESLKFEQVKSNTILEKDTQEIPNNEAPDVPV